ncbi:hypothetical protein ACLKA7_016681 [Drosophila subpalustris]
MKLLFFSFPAAVFLSLWLPHVQPGIVPVLVASQTLYLAMCEHQINGQEQRQQNSRHSLFDYEMSNCKAIDWLFGPDLALGLFKTLIMVQFTEPTFCYDLC